jgi:hypothetical protein
VSDLTSTALDRFGRLPSITRLPRSEIMSTATLDRPAPSTSTRRRTVRKPATLTLMVDGVPYDVRAFDIDDSVSPEGLTDAGLEHSLQGPTGPRFQVYSVDHQKCHCQRCDGDGCAHIRAMAEVGLL